MKTSSLLPGGQILAWLAADSFFSSSPFFFSFSFFPFSQTNSLLIFPAPPPLFSILSSGESGGRNFGGSGVFGSLGKHTHSQCPAFEPCIGDCRRRRRRKANQWFLHHLTSSPTQTLPRTHFGKLFCLVPLFSSFFFFRMLIIRNGPLLEHKQQRCIVHCAQ